MRQAPVLQRLRGRTAARFDIGEDLDGGGEARGGGHAVSILNAKQTHMASSTNTPTAKTLKRVGT